jgi:hypothetical protein
MALGYGAGRKNLFHQPLDLAHHVGIGSPAQLSAQTAFAARQPSPQPMTGLSL